MDELYFELIQSQRVTPRTREVLLARIEDGKLERPIALTSSSYRTLKAVLDRLVPQDDREFPIDIAARLDERHARGEGNGWRYADMPPDQEALQTGLRLLETDAFCECNSSFCDLPGEQQDELLRAVQAGAVRWPDVNPKHWFEELLTGATEIFVSHPDTLAEIGFSGIAILPAGWQKFGLDEGDAWEPRAH